MALKYGWQFNNLFMGRGLYAIGLGGSGYYPNTNFNWGRIYCTVFSGVQPSAASIIADWPTYSAQYLAHFIWANTVWEYYNRNSEGTAYLATVQSPTATAYRTGTATWGIIWTFQNAPSEAQIQGATLPQNTFIVAPVGDFTSTDTIRLQSTSIVATTTATLNIIVIQTALSPGD